MSTSAYFFSLLASIQHVLCVPPLSLQLYSLDCKLHRVEASFCSLLCLQSLAHSRSSVHSSLMNKLLLKNAKLVEREGGAEG